MSSAENDTVRLVAGVIGALYPRTRLVTGVEVDPDEPDQMRVYIDARYEWRFFLTPEIEAAQRAWDSTHSTHLYAVLPEDTTIYVAKPAAMTSLEN